MTAAVFATVPSAAGRDSRAERRARYRAARILADAGQAFADHPYLAAAGVKSLGDTRVHGNFLALPMRDVFGVLHNLQFLDADGNEKFLRGGRKRGCFFFIGQRLCDCHHSAPACVHNGDTGYICPAAALYLSEGYAAVARFCADTGHAGAVVFGAENMPTAAAAIRQRFPEIKIHFRACDERRPRGFATRYAAAPGESHV